MLIALGLGSNLGDRATYLKSAVRELEKILKNPIASSIYESDAVLLENSPQEWNKKFLNMVICGECDLLPQEIFKFIKKTEETLGRVQKNYIWGPREIDVDFIICGEKILDEKEFQVPHKKMLERPFVIWPLAEILPGWRYPVRGDFYNQTALQLAQKFGGDFPKCLKNADNLFNTRKYD